MRLINISCLKTDQTFKNKQTLVRTKRIQKHLKPCTSTVNGSQNIGSVPAEKMVRRILGCDEHDTAFFTLKNRHARTCSNTLINMCVIGALISLITPGSAVEVEESVTINKPIVKGSSDLPGWVHFSPEYVRCFCNLPACVSTGYMCKSSGGGCFSDLLDQASHPAPPNVYRGRHGCLELLTDKEQRSWCLNPPGSGRSSHKKQNHPKSLLLCCYVDMCNYVDSPETRVLLNDTLLGDGQNNSENKAPDNVGTQQDPALYTNSEVWFRAATIAVPICGAVIVLVLITLAVRILRTESLTSSTHKLGISPYELPTENKSNCEKISEHSYRHHNIIRQESLLKDSHHHHNPIYTNQSDDIHGQTYVPLLIQTESNPEQDSCDKKNETYAKLNVLQEHDISLRPCQVMYKDEKSNTNVDLFHKNADIHLNKNMIFGEKDDVLQNYETETNKIYSKEPIS